MLSDTQKSIITATVPVLETGGVALTTHFYSKLLSRYPQVAPLFNQANQASGAQPRALANGVLMYAKHIDKLDGLGPLVSQIINKHVSLQILPEHYPLVGECLLDAIKDVLGEAATPDIIEAWGAAYGQLAEILIGAEEQIYQRNAEADGGWRGARAFKLVGKVVESTEITSLYFAPVDGAPILVAKAGQFIGLRVFIEDIEHRRNYSLSALAKQGEYRISVKRERDGKVSNFLHDRLAVGDSLELFAPAGDFTLAASDKPLLLISGGVGITAMLAMLEAALPSGRSVHFVHCARNRAVQGFRDHVEALAAQHPQLQRFYCYDEGEGDDAVGRLDAQRLAQWLPECRDVDAYFLGPKGFMAAVRRGLIGAGVPAAQCRYEFFGPASALE